MKKEARTYYSKTPHPSYGGDYWADRYKAIHWGNAKTITLKENFFRKYWRKMPVKEMVDTDNLIQSLENIYAKYNDYSTNPYSAENNGQKIVKDKDVGHTSIMVGDIIKVGKTPYIVGGMGFKKVRFV